MKQGPVIHIRASSEIPSFESAEGFARDVRKVRRVNFIYSTFCALVIFVGVVWYALA